MPRIRLTRIMDQTSLSSTMDRLNMLELSEAPHRAFEPSSLRDKWMPLVQQGPQAFSTVLVGLNSPELSIAPHHPPRSPRYTIISRQVHASLPCAIGPCGLDRAEHSTSLLLQRFEIHEYLTTRPCEPSQHYGSFCRVQS